MTIIIIFGRRTADDVAREIFGNFAQLGVINKIRFENEELSLSLRSWKTLFNALRTRGV
jgi:hypothetical protein